jgi:hypothetical protein
MEPEVPNPASHARRHRIARRELALLLQDYVHMKPVQYPMVVHVWKMLIAQSLAAHV